MKFVKQTRLHKGMDRPEDRGNCYPTVIACALDMNPEDVLQFQELYDTVWWEPLCDWLSERGFQIQQLSGHLNDNSYYFVTGISPRNASVNHIVIYQNGNIVFDPHPDNGGIIGELYFEHLIPCN